MYRRMLRVSDIDVTYAEAFEILARVVELSHKVEYLGVEGVVEREAQAGANDHVNAECKRVTRWYKEGMVHYCQSSGLMRNAGM